MATNYIGTAMARAITTPTGVAGAEAANHILVTLNIVDINGNAIEGSTFDVKAELLDGDCLPPLATAYNIADGGAGVLITATGKAACLATTDSHGDLVLDVVDVVGATNTTIHMLITILGIPCAPIRIPLVFDAA